MSRGKKQEPRRVSLSLSLSLSSHSKFISRSSNSFFWAMQAAGVPFFLPHVFPWFTSSFPFSLSNLITRKNKSWHSPTNLHRTLSRLLENAPFNFRHFFIFFFVRLPHPLSMPTENTLQRKRYRPVRYPAPPPLTLGMCKESRRERAICHFLPLLPLLPASLAWPLFP